MIVPFRVDAAQQYRICFHFPTVLRIPGREQFEPAEPGSIGNITGTDPPVGGKAAIDCIGFHAIHKKNNKIK